MSVQGPAGAVDPQALGVHGRPLTLDPPADGRQVLPADALLEGSRLPDLVTGHADDPGTVPPPVAASAWTNHAVGVLVPPVVASWTLHQVGIDASPSNVLLHVEEGLPRRMRLRDPAPAGVGPGARDVALGTLLGGHLTPLLEAVEAAAGLPPRVGWGTAGTLLAWMYDRMAGEAPDEAPVDADRARLLEAETAAWDDGPNPLRDPVERVPVDADDLPDRVLVRRTCCMKREIPSKDPCRTCPNVSPARRRALLRDRGPSGT